jgi:hypothetical protein
MSVVLVLLAACAQFDRRDSDRRILGRVVEVQRSPEANQPPQGLQIFGLFGNWMNDSYDRAKVISRYVVKTPSDELFTAMVDDDFFAGECVEVIPTRSEPARATDFAYGRARMIASNRC